MTKISFFQYFQTNIHSISKKDTQREEFVADQLDKVRINPSLSSKMRHDLIDVLYKHINAFASYSDLLGTIRGHRPYPLVLRRQAYPEILGETYPRVDTAWCTNKGRP
ncbi:hypothetical protein O181_034866 [Austropuccinia psidii MF-1]|uniref:Uncharacterized protein n=1 Tax=Austropuccinia psidii MF-1 TaxID=1389203 RepID=A0A9Q3D1L1_9BASI|nr:hypothetical protein [Austropuccinia psidii MF-1]